MTKEKNTSAGKSTAKTQTDSNLAIVSMILGIVSLTGPGLLLGIPAIVTASIALKKNVTNRGLSIVGLVTGIISTTVSIIFLSCVAFLVIWGVSHPEDFEQRNQTPDQSEQQPYSSSRT